MTTRNFKQCGQAYGATPASITATIDGTVVYTGSVPTIDQPVPVRPDPAANIATPEIFTWTNTVDFRGSQSYSIAVTGSPLLLGDTSADHCANDVAQFNSFNNYLIDGVLISDPFTNVAIDGVAMQRGPDNTTFSGQWQWLIPAGSTFTAVMNINSPSAVPYIQFDSIPSTIQPGESGTFVTSIPNVSPDWPLPRTFGWRVVHITTTNADFQAVTGSVPYNTSTASFDITTVAHDPPQSSKTFRIEMYGSISGNILGTSDIVTIT
jgi:hypothetical protein